MTEAGGTILAGAKSQNSLLFKLPVFEGPLDLLLHLIKEKKIDIYDIPIVEITKQYIEYLELMKELNLEIAGEFLVMAATLIYIKSRMLLPSEEKEDDEPAEDPRAELVQRLLEYQAFKEASSHLRERETIWKNIFRRNLPPQTDLDEGEPLPFEATLFDLVTAFKNLLSKTREDVVIEITRETLTVSDRINHIMEAIEGKDGMRFEDLFEQPYTRIRLIITFLALLELIRLGLVKAFQDRTFGSIWIVNAQKARSEIEAEPVSVV
jgi:segregation and condensation protein A